MTWLPTSWFADTPGLENQLPPPESGFSLARLKASRIDVEGACEGTPLYAIEKMPEALKTTLMSPPDGVKLETSKIAISGEVASLPVSL